MIGALLIALSMGGTAIAAPAPVQQTETTSSASQILVMLRLAEQHYRPNAHYSGGYGDDIHRHARRRLAARIAQRHGLKLIDNWPMPLIGVDCFVMAVTDGRTTEEAAQQVSHDGAVAWSQPLQFFHTQATPVRDRDPLLPLQPATREWQLPDLHRMATGRGVTVAVVDSRIESGHPDLLGQVPITRDFVAGRAVGAEQHGTAVAGVIAAIADNGMGVAGVAPRAKLMGLRACWQQADQDSSSKETVCDSLSLAKALYFAIEHKARIINMSLSGPHDLLLAKLLKIGMAKGIVVVAAFDPELPRGGFPASQPGVIAVSDASLPAQPSGVYIAPGQDVPTTQPGGRWYLVNGSSYAAAHVSGLVALLRERSARRASPSLVSAREDGGAINACLTLFRAAKRCDCSCSGTPKAASAQR